MHWDWLALLTHNGWGTQAQLCPDEDDEAARDDEAWDDDASGSEEECTPDDGAEVATEDAARDEDGRRDDDKVAAVEDEERTELLVRPEVETAWDDASNMDEAAEEESPEGVPHKQR